MLSRFGVLGDIHTEDERLSLALDHFRDAGVDTLLSVGDILDGGGDADRTCSLLRGAGVVAVTGNHDRWFLKGTSRGGEGDTLDLNDDHRAWLVALPSSRRFASPRGGVLLCHGVGDDDMAVLRPDTDAHSLRWMSGLHELQRDPTVALMVGGHTHQRMVRALPGLTVINAGTLHRGYAPGFIVVDLGTARVETFDIDGGAVRAAETLDIPLPPE